MENAFAKTAPQVLLPLQKSTKSRKTPQQTLAEWEQKICPNYSDILFSDYLRPWLEEIEPMVSPSTFYAYRLQVNNRICPWFDERSIKLVD